MKAAKYYEKFIVALACLLTVSCVRLSCVIETDQYRFKSYMNDAVGKAFNMEMFDKFLSKVVENDRVTFQFQDGVGDEVCIYQVVVDRETNSINSWNFIGGGQYCKMYCGGPAW